MEELKAAKTKAAGEPNRLARIAAGQKVEAVIHEQVLTETPLSKYNTSICGMARSKLCTTSACRSREAKSLR